MSNFFIEREVNSFLLKRLYGDQDNPLHLMKNLQDRTRVFALNIIRFCNSLPNHSVYRVIRYQLLRSATSVGANYRAACHAQSRPAFLAKLAIVEEQTDETLFWLELLRDLEYQHDDLPKLLDEASQLTAIIVASRKTAKRNR